MSFSFSKISEKNKKRKFSTALSRLQIFMFLKQKKDENLELQRNVKITTKDTITGKIPLQTHKILVRNDKRKIVKRPPSKKTKLLWLSLCLS